MPDEAIQQGRSKRLLRWTSKVLIGAVLALGALLLLFWIVAGLVWYFIPSLEVSHMAKANPNVFALPQPLRDTHVAELKGQPICVLGYSMQFPWGEVQRRYESDGYATLMFKSGEYFRISTESGEKSPHWRFQSNYAHLLAEVQALPSDVRWWHSRERNEHAASLLSAKYLATSSSGYIFPVNAGEMRGFQFGSPGADRIPRVALELVDKNGRSYQITMYGGNPRKGGGPVTQPQINAILASIHPWPAGVPVPPGPDPNPARH